MAEDPEIENDAEGISRRRLLRGAAIAGGTLMWSAPAIKSMATVGPAPGSCLPLHSLCACGGPECCPGLVCVPGIDAGVNCSCLAQLI